MAGALPVNKKQAEDPVAVPCFEESLEMLERAVAELEDGKLSLTDALARYEEGIRHLKLCYQSLREAERKIELLAGVDAEGRAVTKPFDDAATEADEKRPPRSRRRSAAPADETQDRGRKGAPAQPEQPDMDASPGLF